MKTILRSTLRKAKALQGRYNTLKSPSTQNVRNPFPMRELVQMVLPALPDPNAMIPVTLEFSFTFHGRKFVKREMSNEFAGDIIKHTEWTRKARSVHQVMADLQSMGYVVNSQATVAQALTAALHTGKVASVPQLRPRGRPRSLYFATK